MMVSRLSVIGLVLLFTPQVQADAGAAAGAARVMVWPAALPDRIVYHYHVTNRQPGSTIAGVTVGYDYRQKELLLTSGLPAGSRICSPDGWSGMALADAASGKYNIVWGSDNTDYDIKAGDGLAGFAIELPVANSGLAKTFFTVEFSRGKIGFASAPITAGDASTITPLANCADPHTGKPGGTAQEQAGKKPAGAREQGGCDD